jgi:hypothetical protein
MFEAEFFSICSIDSLLKIMGRSRKSKAYEMLYALHCRHYSDMSDELRERLPTLVREAIFPAQKRCVATEIVLTLRDGSV